LEDRLQQWIEKLNKQFFFSEQELNFSRFLQQLLSQIPNLAYLYVKEQYNK
jgi:hypothetical protein